MTQGKTTGTATDNENSFWWEEVLGSESVGLQDLPPPDADFTEALLQYTAPPSYESYDDPYECKFMSPGVTHLPTLVAGPPCADLPSSAQYSPSETELSAASPGACSLMSVSSSSFRSSSGGGGEGRVASTVPDVSPLAPSSRSNTPAVTRPAKSRRGRRQEAQDGNQAAKAARQNREKKKAYVRKVEEELLRATERATQAEKVLRPWQERAGLLLQEVTYLRRVVEHDGDISRVIKTLPDVKVIRLVCPEAAAPVPSAVAVASASTASPAAISQSGCGASAAAAAQPPTPSGGVCVHVQGGEVSVRFCASCSLV